MVKKNKKILELRDKFPQGVGVVVKKEDDCYLAKIKYPRAFAGAFTQASSFSELIAMINDCVQTILEIPDKYASEMPQYMPPLSLAQALNAFPKIAYKESVQFSIDV